MTKNDSDFPRTLPRKGQEVKIYRGRDSRSNSNDFTVVYYAGQSRRRATRRTIEEAQKLGEEILETLCRNQVPTSLSMEDWELLKKLKKVARNRSPWRMLEDVQSAAKVLEDSLIKRMSAAAAFPFLHTCFCGVSNQGCSKAWPRLFRRRCRKPRRTPQTEFPATTDIANPFVSAYSLLSVRYEGDCQREAANLRDDPLDMNSEALAPKPLSDAIPATPKGRGAWFFPVTGPHCARDKRRKNPGLAASDPEGDPEIVAMHPHLLPFLLCLFVGFTSQARHERTKRRCASPPGRPDGKGTGAPAQPISPIGDNSPTR